MNAHRTPFVWTLLTGLLATSAVVSAQSGGDAPPTDAPSRYFLGREEQMLLPVNIIGLVQKPGQYMVPYRTNLISLIAYAGGFREDAKINAIKIVRVMPTTNGARNGKEVRPRSVVYTVNMKKFFEKGDRSQIPQLMPDDTVIVYGTAKRTVNQVFDLLSKLLVVAQIAFYVAVISDINRR